MGTEAVYKIKYEEPIKHNKYKNATKYERYN
jgi:hypothetical protein